MGTAAPQDRSPHDGATLSEALAVMVPASLWLGLVTGLAEVALKVMRRHFVGRFNNLGQQMVWMTPLADVVILGALGVLFWALIRWRQDARLARWALTACAFLSALAILMLYYPLHPWARLVLAAGVAVQFGRIATRWRLPFLGIVHATLAWPFSLWRLLTAGRRDRAGQTALAPETPGRRDFLVGTGATLGVLAAGVHGPPFVREWLSLRRAGPRPGAPNVLLIVLDTVRAASLSLYGHARDTSPELKRLAARGITFSRAYSHSPWTLPSHGSLFTGCYPHELSGTFQRPLDSQHRVLAEAMTDAGFATGGFIANRAYCSYESGLDRGFLHYEDFAVSLAELINSSVLANHVSEIPAIARRRKFELLGRKPASEISRGFLSWADGLDGRPFFAFLNYFDAHAPYLAPPPFDTKFGPAIERPNMLHTFGHRWTPDQYAAELAAYEGTISYLDAEIARLVAALESRSLLEKTLIVITSDHGELFGEHGLMDHANSLYAPLLHVPLIMLWPGRLPAGTAVDRPVGLRHLPATIMELAGLDPSALRGHSLARHWQQGGVARAAEPILSTLEHGIRVEPHWRNARGPVHSIIDGDRQYIRNSDGSEELYDLVNDPKEATNLAASSDLGELRQTMDRLLAEGSRGR